MKHTIYLAGGCFWGLEEFFRHVDGIEETTVGYGNSVVEHPTYEQVCTGNTGAVEVLKIVYDAKRVDLITILRYFFVLIDPVSVNKQGNDVGTQYRTGIYYEDEEDYPIIELVVDATSRRYDQDIATEVLKLKNFTVAEEYHQDYLQKKPEGYCHIDMNLLYTLGIKESEEDELH